MSQLESSNRADASLVPMEMREEALRDHRREAKITEGLRKSKGSSRSQAGARGSQLTLADGHEFDE